jgi:hypothetical protein
MVKKDEEEMEMGWSGRLVKRVTSRKRDSFIDARHGDDGQVGYPWVGW